MEEILARVHILVNTRLDPSSLDKTVRNARNYFRRLRVEIPAEVKFRGRLEGLGELARRRSLVEPPGVQPVFVQRAASAVGALSEKELGQAVAGAFRVLPLQAAPRFIAGMSRAVLAAHYMSWSPALSEALLESGKNISQAAHSVSQTIRQAGNAATLSIPTLEEGVAELQRRQAALSETVASAYATVAQRTEEAAAVASADIARSGAELAAAERAAGEAVSAAGVDAQAVVALLGEQYPELGLAITRELANMVQSGQAALGDVLMGVSVGIRQWQDILGRAGIDPLLAAKDTETAVSLFAQALAATPELLSDLGLSGQAQAIAASVAIDRAATVLGESMAGLGSHVAASAAATVDQIASAIRAIFPNITTRMAKQFAGMVAAGELSIEDLTHGIQVGMSRWSEVLRGVGLAPSASVEQVAEAFRKLNAAVTGTPIQALEQIGLKGRAQIVALTVALKQAAVAIKGTDITSLRNMLRQQLAFMGVEGVPKAILDTAAKAVQGGVLTIEQAVQAIATGYTEAGKITRKSGENALGAARNLASLNEQLERTAAGAGAGAPPGSQPPGATIPPVPPEQAAKTLEIASAFDKARKSARGFMQSLTTLRWEIFTVMFFAYTFKKALNSVVNSAINGARTVDRVTNAILVLRDAGVQNIRELALEVQKYSAGSMSQAEAVIELGRLAAIGLPPKLLGIVPKLMQIATATALVTGEVKSQPEALEKITDSIARGEIRMARTIGVVSGNMTDLLDMYKQSADASAAWSDELKLVVSMLDETGARQAKSVEQLTQYQKSLLITWAILYYGEAVLQSIGGDTDKLTRQTNSLEQAWKDLGTSFSSIAGKIVAPGISYISKLLYALYGTFIMVGDAIGLTKVSAEEWAEANARAIETLKGLTPEELVTIMSATSVPSMGWVTSLAEATGQMAEFTLTGEGANRVISFLTISELGRMRALDGVIDSTRTEVEITDEARSKLQQFQDVLKATGVISDSTSESLNEMSSVTVDLIGALRQAGEMFLEWMRWEEDFQIEQQRWEEDLARERRKRLKDAEEEYRKSLPKLQKDYSDRMLEAWRDYQRRLENINEELADRLRSIWRDYYDEMLRAEMDRDAEAAFWAARRRDREIQEAQEAAEQQRADAYRAYQDAIENAQKQYQEQLAQLRERYQQELEETRSWEELEREERAIRDQREREDREREAQRRLQDLMRNLMLEYELQRISNDQTLTEEERFRRAAAVIMSAYARDQIVTTTDMVNALKALHVNYFGFIYNQFGQLRTVVSSGGASVLTGVQTIVQNYLNWLNGAISYTITLLSVLRSMAGASGVTVPGSSPSGGQPRMRAKGGIDIVAGPTHFVAGEAGPELVITQPLREGGYPVGMLPITMTHNLSAIVRAEVAGLTGQIEAAVSESLERLFRSGFHKVRGW